MTITVKEAIKHFFASPSFEMIYSEAVANALDAGATKMSISIDIKSFQAPDTIKMVIEDNGVGFTKENFKRFQSLMQSHDEHHKGLGRLVYLAYFKNVRVESVFEGVSHRVFEFNEKFEGDCKLMKLKNAEPSYARFEFSGFSNRRFKTYDDLKPQAIKDLLRKQFMARMYMMRVEKKEFEVEIGLKVEEPNLEKGLVTSSAVLRLSDLPALQEMPVDCRGLDFFANDCRLLYAVLRDEWRERVSTSICVDGRAIPFPNVMKQADLPNGTSAIFLLQSSYFDSKADDARQNVKLSKDVESIVVKLFQQAVSKVLTKEVPEIQERNEKYRLDLLTRYPHLSGYFSADSVGVVNPNRVLEEARDKFFKEQKEILEAGELTDELYDKSLDHATRVLTEYVLYRNLIIDKLSKVDAKEKEAKIHGLIVPMQNVFEKADAGKILYRNNAWILDDKYMGYSSILSDKNLKELVEKLSGPDELKSEDTRPDIAFVFSDDIETSDHQVDVVIVELKKKGLGYLDNKTVLDQIRMRARRLGGLYPNKIQRMWFFGIVDFDDELLVEMEEGWTPIYSKGQVYYRQEMVLPVDKDLKKISDVKIPVPITLMSFDALIGDAKARNETFLSILKNSIQEYSRQQNV